MLSSALLRALTGAQTQPALRMPSTHSNGRAALGLNTAALAPGFTPAR